jgi:hypothetical protein
MSYELPVEGVLMLNALRLGILYGHPVHRHRQLHLQFIKPPLDGYGTILKVGTNKKIVGLEGGK